MSGYMPVIKLPTSKHKPSVVRQSRVFSTANKSDISKEELFDHSNDCLVSETLFLSKLPANIKEADIRTLLQHCMPVEIYIDKERDIGYLRFSHVKYADKAYSLYNGFTFTNSAKLELQMYEDKSLDPEATAMLLEVDGLPEYYDDNILYDLFRPFGPLNLCKCILKDGVFKGSAFIQFFDPSNSDKAEASLNGRIIDEQQL
ncbi:hypothetical protein BDF20DRAFT_671628 [Mycotypha africana]|uniref:uncharacterized protein n=1 Tax=Mycotypha africana TaxID=64632 RepID=UPI0023017B35|nr:uncharacterized protein BDF20DRAFT_671628 [Mycotypha africana]KAI8973768.1 hypothetical protein BDF20DRAFT_671628 [Mycotypha africana]